MKKIIALLLVLTMMFSITSFAEEEKVEISFKIGDSTLMINGTPVTVETPYVTNGVTMVPVRVITEAFGANVGWDGETETVSIEYKDISISMPIGSRVCKVNGEDKALLEAPVVLGIGTTMVPIRFISETFGADVGWDEKNQAVLVTLGAEPEQKPEPKPEDEKTEDAKLGEADDSVLSEHIFKREEFGVEFAYPNGGEIENNGYSLIFKEGSGSFSGGVTVFLDCYDVDAKEYAEKYEDLCQRATEGRQPKEIKTLQCGEKTLYYTGDRYILGFYDVYPGYVGVFELGFEKVEYTNAFLKTLKLYESSSEPERGIYNWVPTHTETYNLAGMTLNVTNDWALEEEEQGKYKFEHSSTSINLFFYAMQVQGEASAEKESRNQAADYAGIENFHISKEPYTTTVNGHEVWNFEITYTGGNSPVKLLTAIFVKNNIYYEVVVTGVQGARGEYLYEIINEALTNMK